MSFLKGIVKKKGTEEQNQSVEKRKKIIKFLFNQKYKNEPSCFENHKPLGKELSVLWKQRTKSTEQTDINSWYCCFSDFMLESYSGWNPPNTHLDRIQNYNKKLKQAIKLDQAHPKELIIRTLQSLFIFGESLLKNYKSREIRLAISFEVILLLVRSQYNTVTLLKYQILEVLKEVGSNIQKFLENMVKEFQSCTHTQKGGYLTKQLNQEQNNDFLLFQYLISRYIDIVTALTQSHSFWKKTNQTFSETQQYDWISKFGIIDIFLVFFETFLQLKSFCLFSEKQFKIFERLIKFFHIMIDLEEINATKTKGFCERLTKILGPPDLTLPFLEIKNESTNIVIYGTNLVQFSNKQKIKKEVTNEIITEFIQKNQPSPMNEIREFEYNLRISILLLIVQLIDQNSIFEFELTQQHNLSKIADFLLWVSYTFTPNWVKEFIKNNQNEYLKQCKIHQEKRRKKQLKIRQKIHNKEFKNENLLENKFILLIKKKNNKLQNHNKNDDEEKENRFIKKEKKLISFKINELNLPNIVKCQANYSILEEKETPKLIKNTNKNELNHYLDNVFKIIEKLCQISFLRKQSRSNKKNRNLKKLTNNNNINMDSIRNKFNNNNSSITSNNNNFDQNKSTNNINNINNSNSNNINNKKLLKKND
ncbi:anillin/rhotekin rtkn [Anaeramoeba flamelloides]|uniref:Anillin/rhotekin rtkn n=1 Tax=Anaeramoeba flamelloides TaxID=1746091 RepID=A0ABQ8Z6F5_9EUKA|nr:anillin/rhotekin rtkn [Anaeramoeba flamelloides]